MRELLFSLLAAVIMAYCGLELALMLGVVRPV